MEPHNILPSPGQDRAGSVESMPNPSLVPEVNKVIQTSEQASQTAELPQASPMPTTGTQDFQQQLTPPSSQSTQTIQPTIAQDNSGLLAADDADLIEKEWVERAKGIISQTTHDPHQQNQEISKIKADYIKKRYNKDIKIQEV